MSYRPRRPKFSREQWEVQRERFQIPEDAPVPVDDHPTGIKEPLQHLLKSLGLERNTLQNQLMNHWEAMAGKPLCRHIRPGIIQDGQLIIYVSNSPMLSELTRFQGPALLKNIQAVVGAKAIKKLRFQLDPDTRVSTRQNTSAT
jgi:hypothetical protein